VYREPDVILLDDPLSAVDSAVGRHLFTQCITAHLSATARVLVTHQLQYLEAADCILVMNNVCFYKIR
jgi:ABC-type sulfate/molybdate transport systems ATPase subunit